MKKKFVMALIVSILAFSNVSAAEYKPYSKPLKNELVESLSLSQDDITVIRNQYIPKTRLKRNVDSWEYLITNNSDKDIVLEKIETNNCLSLTQSAHWAIIPSWEDFIPLYGIIRGAQVDIEKNKFTRPLPLNVTIKPEETLRILTMTDKNKKPLVDLYFLTGENQTFMKLTENMQNKIIPVSEHIKEVSVSQDAQEFYHQQVAMYRYPWTGTGFIKACSKGEKTLVEYYIKGGFDVNQTYIGQTPLVAAISREQSHVVALLLKNGAKPNEKAKKLVNKTKNQEIKSYFQKL